jgi:predicted ester cyclase
MTERTTDDARVERNKATVRQMLEKLSAGDVEGYTDHLTYHYVRHCQSMPPDSREMHGKQAMYEWLVSTFLTFEDYTEEAEWLGGEGDFVFWRARGKGTQSGPYGPFQATGKRMDLVIIGMHRFEGSLVAETWTSWDNLAALTQLGHYSSA